MTLFRWIFHINIPLSITRQFTASPIAMWIWLQFIQGAPLNLPHPLSFLDLKCCTLVKMLMIRFCPWNVLRLIDIEIKRDRMIQSQHFFQIVIAQMECFSEFEDVVMVCSWSVMNVAVFFDGADPITQEKPSWVFHSNARNKSNIPRQCDAYKKLNKTGARATCTQIHADFGALHYNVVHREHQLITSR